MPTEPVSRREWLAGVAMTTAIAAPATGTPVADTPGSPKQSFGFCLNTSTVRDKDGKSRSITDLIDIAAKAGYDAFEPWTSEIDAYLKDGGTLKELRKLLGEALKSTKRVCVLLDNLDKALDSYRQLRDVDEHRFQDSDLYRIVLGATLNVNPFKKLHAGEIRRLCIENHERLERIKDKGNQSGVIIKANGVDCQVKRDDGSTSWTSTRRAESRKASRASRSDPVAREPPS